MGQVSDPVSSQTFSLVLPANPERVWAALTCPAASARFLHGLSAHSTWEPAAPVSFRSGSGPVIVGQVLYADPPHQLAYTLEDPDCGSTAYLVWQLRVVPTGCGARLTVHEADARAGSDEELGDIWLPVLKRLSATLAGS